MHASRGIGPAASSRRALEVRATLFARAIGLGETSGGPEGVR